MAVSGKKPKSPKLISKQLAVAGLVLAVAFLVAGSWVYAAHQPPEINPVTLQWSASLTPKALAGLGPDSAGFRTALDWDLLALIPGYLVGLLSACYLGCRVFWTPRSRAWARRGLAAAALAGACNIAQDLLLKKALSDGLRAGALLDSAEVLSFAKFTALLVAGSIGIAAIMVTSARLATSNRTRAKWAKAATKCGAKDGDCGTAKELLVIPPPKIEAATSRVPDLKLAHEDWWQRRSAGARASWAQGFAAPSGRAESKTGVCVSGGGIRSATVALGALNALREEGVLGQAEYLVSVSGGGFTVGGLQLAMTRAAEREPYRPAPCSQATAGNAFAPGSPEEDHLRRHSSYIADGLGQWIVALGVLLRGVLSSLVIIGVTITTLGLALGEFYSRVPVTAGGVLPKPRFAVTGQNVPAPAYPGIPFGVWCAIAVVGGLTVLAYLTRQLTASQRRVRRASHDRGGLAGRHHAAGRARRGPARAAVG